MRCTLILLAAMLMLDACAPPPPVTQSRDALWDKYAHRSVDDILLAWSTPQAESKLTNGSRLLTYRHSTIYDAGNSYNCEVTFLAPPPRFTIENIAMSGDARDCQQLADHGPDTVRPPPPPPPPGFEGAYYR